MKLSEKLCASFPRRDLKGSSNLDS